MSVRLSSKAVILWTVDRMRLAIMSGFIIIIFFFSYPEQYYNSILSLDEMSFDTENKYLISRKPRATND